MNESKQVSLPSPRENSDSLVQEISYLRGKLKSQDGKLFLLTAQIEKFQLQKAGLENELSLVRDQFQIKSDENLTLLEGLKSYKSQLMSAHGKIQLLNYQLAKSKLYPIESTYTDYLFYFISHYTRYLRVLRDLEAKAKPHFLPEAEMSSKPFGVTFRDPVNSSSGIDQINDSFSVSRLIHHESILSDDVTRMDLSSYSLNTTMQQTYRPIDAERHYSMSARTPDINELRRKRKSRELPVTRILSREKSKTQLDENIFNTETQKNLRELKQTVNAEGFSIFTSPSSFRENIVRIRTENEKLRSDIYRFRGKLEVCDSFFHILITN